jgi:tyrosinase
MLNDSRRAFLKNTVLLASAVMTGLKLTASQAQLSQNGVRVRRDIGELDLDDPVLETYREAIAAMQALPANDPRNWNNQAQLHLQFCPHANWFFLPWHRAYLAAFEAICRDLTGNNDFALPYWDWAKDPQVPAAFYEPEWHGQPNPLINDTRLVGPNDTIPADTTGCEVIEGILDETDFELFASGQPVAQTSTDPSFQRAVGFSAPLEGTPHNGVHVFVSGDMVTFMSPLDPVFWLHHCNVDRIWALWNSRANPNTDDPLWLDFMFAGNFVTPQNDTFDVPVRDLQDTLALGYRYDNVALPPESAMLARPRTMKIARESFANTEAKIAKPEQETAFTVKLSAAATETAQGKTPATESGRVSRVLAVIREVTIPKNLDVRVRVFLNCSYLEPDTPSNDPHYVGSFTFFADHAAMEHSDHNTRSYTFDLTPTLTKLRRSQREISDELKVQLIPVSFSGKPIPDVEIKTESVEIIVS